MTKKRFDYIVVGAGSAGCVIASRLSEDADVSVLLIESGGLTRWWDFKLRVPAAKGLALKDERFNWGHKTVPQAHLSNRSLPLYQGRVVGGSSTINGMLFVRGNPGDYDGWAKDPELSHWQYDNVLPYFKKLERHLTSRSPYRGADGPVGIQTARGDSPLGRLFLQAGVEAGFPESDDVNGPRQEGFGLMDMNVEAGCRVSAWDAYIKPHLGRPNLTVLHDADVVRLTFEKRRCIGLDATVDGQQLSLRAGREVIVCAGALGSPALLLRSGIGPAQDLRGLGIPVIHDLPGVGENLHDHPQVCLPYTTTKPVSLQPLVNKKRYVITGTRWFMTRKGWGASNHFEAGGFLRSEETVTWPDVQLQFSPHTVTRFDTGLSSDAHGFQVHAGPTRPKSRGHVKLSSARHDAPLVIDPAYLSHPDDRRLIRVALRIARRVVAQPAFDHVRGQEILPGPSSQSDADLDAYIRATAGSGYHPCGTCRMGTSSEAVVDGALRVHGVDGLRVADSSIIPSVPTGNINAPTLMIGEVASDLIRKRHASQAQSDAREKSVQ